jgi:hypothetical protein
MQARPTILMPEGSANAIETSNSLLPSQRTMDNLDASPMMQPVPWEIIPSLGIFLTIGVLIYACIPKRKQHSSRVKVPSTIRCFRCQYFNDNNFLNCALHPVIVMTEEAIDCKDYYPKAEAKQVEKLRKVLLRIQNLFS